MQDASETLRALEAAVTEARTFFGIDPLFRTPVLAEGAGDAACRIHVSPGYFQRPIGVDLDYYQRKPEEIRRGMAHEVAHLATDELASIFQRMPPEWSDADQPLARLLIDALEKATVRLECLFMRERP